MASVVPNSMNPVVTSISFSQSVSAETIVMLSSRSVSLRGSLNAVLYSA